MLVSWLSYTTGTQPNSKSRLPDWAGFITLLVLTLLFSYATGTEGRLLSRWVGWTQTLSMLFWEAKADGRTLPLLTLASRTQPVRHHASWSELCYMADDDSKEHLSRCTSPWWITVRGTIYNCWSRYRIHICYGIRRQSSESLSLTQSQRKLIFIVR